jgi:hypothetical protein
MISVKEKLTRWISDSSTCTRTTSRAWRWPARAAASPIRPSTPGPSSWRARLRTRAPRWWPSPNSACRPIPATTCSTSARCSTPCVDALGDIVEASKTLPLALIVGMPLRVNHVLFNCAVVVAAGASWAWCRRATCPIMANFTKAAVQCRGQRAVDRNRACSDRRCPSVRTSCSTGRTCRCSASTSRSAKTSGCRCRRRPSRRWPAPPCWSTCRPRTSWWARAATATSWSASSRRAAWRPICTPRPGWANRPPTWPGTASR